MNKKFFLSIIIPVYNCQQYLSECIDSLLNQDYPYDFEIILINDGSSDNSGNICEQYAQTHKFIKVFHCQNNGVSHARNIGISKSKGSYISFIDSDDFVTKDYISTIKENIENVDLLFFSNNRLLEDGSIIGQYHTNINCQNKEETENLLLKLKRYYTQYEYFGYTWNKCFRSDIIKKNNLQFIEGLHLREDEIFTNQYCKYITSCKFIQKGIYFYREKQTTGLTNSIKTNKDWLNLCTNLDISTDWIQNEELIKHEKNRIYQFYSFLKLNNRNSFSQYYTFCRKNFSYLYLSKLKKILFSLPFNLAYVCFIIYNFIKKL